MATVSSAPRTTTITLASATAGPFDVGFRVFDTDKLSVFVNGLPRADWSFVDFTFADGFCDAVQIEFFDALADGDEIIIDGDLTPIRGQDYVNGDPRMVAKINVEMARIWSSIAEVKRDTKRSLRTFGEVDAFEMVADAVPIWSGDQWDSGPTSGEIASAQSYAESAALSSSQAALYGGDLWLDAAADVASDEALTYDDGVGQVLAGQYIRTRAEGYSYEVAASAATDQHLTTAGGVKLYILPNGAGEVEWGATGAVSGASDHGDEFDALLAAMTRAATNVARFGPGTWRFAYRDLPAGFTAHCAEYLTIFKPVSSSNKAIFTQDSESDTDYIAGPVFHGATFHGAEATPTFSEFYHLVTLNGSDGAAFYRCRWIGWRGDALYLGSGDDGGTERHNRNIRVVDCFFDGVNRENRQAISVIDCDGLRVVRSKFQNTTKGNMPGVIDLEPDSAAYHIIKNVWIENNEFVACGGNVGTIAVYIQATVPLPHNINITGNIGRDLVPYPAAGFVTIDVNRELEDTDDDMAVRIEGNTVTGSTGRPYQLLCVKGLRARGNTFADCDRASILGYLASDQMIMDVSIADTFLRCGADNANGAEILNCANLDMSGSVFDDCGDGRANAAAMNFKSGTSSRVVLDRVVVRSPTGKTLRATLKDAGHTFDATTNRAMQFDFGSLPYDFQAHESDLIWTAYTPIVEGTSSAGSGTYTTQVGRWRRIGKQVFFEAYIVQTAHTGTGQIEISLPVDATQYSNWRPISVMLDGASHTGGVIGVINADAVADGVLGCARCFQSQTGTLAQVTVPTGAASYWVSGTYMAK